MTQSFPVSILHTGYTYSEILTSVLKAAGSGVASLGTDTCTAFWEKAARDIGEMVGGKWKNHPLAVELGMGVYSYLEQKCRSKSSGAEVTT